MRGFPRHGRWLAGALLGGCLALVPTAVPASAELSSVDAYGGQAQVLGKPVHRHAAPGGSSSTKGSGSGGEQGTGASGSQAGGGSAGSSPGSGAHPSTSPSAGSSAGTHTTPSASNSVSGAGASNAAGGRSGGTSGHGGGGGGASSTTAGGVSGAAGGGGSPPIALANSAAVSDGSLSLSALDVLLLVVVFAGLAGVGVLIRRWSREVE
jgi:hypothetical protein